MAVQNPHTVAPGVTSTPKLLVEGSSSFSNLHLFLLVVAVPKLLQWTFPLLNKWSKLYWILLVLTALPTLIGYWAFQSNFGARRNEKVQLPGKPIDHYLTFNDPVLRKKYLGRKIPMQILYDAYFEGKIDFKGKHNSSSSPMCGLREEKGAKAGEMMGRDVERRAELAEFGSPSRSPPFERSWHALEPLFL